ncbi:MAG: DNA primase [Chloroflexi bacterium]|nr:DNA primase [Chloroflexota bacterium]
MSTIEDVKARLDIVETVGSYVPNLKRSGRTWKANCPFHNERTPSFIVDPSRGSWHCFGACSTGGDVIEFVRRIEGLDFREALGRCAERAGVELRPPTRREVERREEHERLLAANDAATLFYQAQLAGPRGAEARAYTERRGLDAATQREWQLGYAPDEWSALTDHLTARGFQDRELVAAGLAIEGQRGLYDRFRGRLIFPTRDVRGRMVGFGGRALGADQEPKYLNTPRTPLFDKSGTMYGLDRGGIEARREDRLIVVEGYMDVIACHQAGIENVAASMGTAITEAQMQLIKRFTPNVVLALDADNAGSEATIRAVEVASGAADQDTVATIDWRGLVSFQNVLQADIRIAALPEGEDPDSLVRSDPARLRALIDEAKPVADHLFEAVAERTDLDDPRARSQAVEAIVPTVAAMADPIVQAEYVQRLARLGRVDERTVLGLLARRTPTQRRARRGGDEPPPPPDPDGGAARPTPVPSAREEAAARRTSSAAQSDPALTDVHPGEAQLLRLLLLRPECREAGLELDPDTFEHGLNRQLFEAWAETGSLDDGAFEDDEDLRAHRAAIEGSGLSEAYGAMTGPQLAEAVRGTARTLRARRQQERLRAAASAAAHELSEGRRNGESDDQDELAVSLAGMAARQRELVHVFRNGGEVADGLENGDNGSATWTHETAQEQAHVGAPSRAAPEVMEEPDDADV